MPSPNMRRLPANNCEPQIPTCACRDNLWLSWPSMAESPIMFMLLERPAKGAGRLEVCRGEVRRTSARASTC